jgi:hypothetical protein
MKLTDDHKVQIFCAALSSTIQADATIAASGEVPDGPGSIEKASALAAEAIAKLQSKAWA